MEMMSLEMWLADEISSVTRESLEYSKLSSQRFQDEVGRGKSEKLGVSSILRLGGIRKSNK